MNLFLGFILKRFPAQDDAENHKNRKPNALANKPVGIHWADNFDPKEEFKNDVGCQNTDKGTYDTSQHHPEKIRDPLPEKETGQNSDAKRQNQRQKWN